MTKITLKGNEIHTNGDIPKIGDEAPDFVLVNEDLNNVTLEDYKNKNKILSIVPSLDTPVCQTSTKVFNEKASSVKDTIILTISADLPFAMTRFCSSEKLNIILAISFIGSAKAYLIKLYFLIKYSATVSFPTLFFPNKPISILFKKCF